MTDIDYVAAVAVAASLDSVPVGKKMKVHIGMKQEAEVEETSMVVDTTIEVDIEAERVEVEGTTVAAEEVGVCMNVVVEVVVGRVVAAVAKPCLDSAFRRIVKN
jgi:hypothetical protein